MQTALYCKKFRRGGGKSSPVASSMKTYPHHSGCCLHNQQNWSDYYYRLQERNYVFSFDVKVMVVNLGMTTTFPRAEHLTLTSLWRLFPSYLLLVFHSIVTLLFPKLCTPAMQNTPSQSHRDKKEWDRVKVFQNPPTGSPAESGGIHLRP